VILHNKWRDRITIDRHYSANKIIIKGNEGKLHQALMNILSNAIQAIEGEGTITLTTGQKGKKAIISIQDDGAGMSDELVARITDPFFTTRAPGEGVGLGLFITQAIIEEHKGKMEVFSHPNEGTEVLITI
jgi:signal transduction histidine kinase